ncbi:MAG: ATP-binding protein [Anaerovoracaceae bacterium]|jgi:serine/threonine-protein kinase RsbW
MKEVIEMKVPGDPDYIAITKMTAASAAAHKGFDIDKVEDIRMAVGEGCKAITCHRHKGWSDQYDVKLDMREEGKIIIDIEDSIFTHDQEKGSRPCLDCPHEGDLGIEILKALMDDVQIVKQGGTCRRIKMVKVR